MRRPVVLDSGVHGRPVTSYDLHLPAVPVSYRQISSHVDITPGGSSPKPDMTGLDFTGPAKARDWPCHRLGDGSQSNHHRRNCKWAPRPNCKGQLSQSLSSYEYVFFPSSARSLTVSKFSALTAAVVAFRPVAGISYRT
ncbi:unnamed protein product [Calypogeia fissa]